MLKEVVPFFSCVATPDSMAEALQKYQEVYFQNPDGSVLKHSKLSHGRSVRIPVKTVPKAVKDALPDVYKVVPELNFLPAGKIPMIYFEQIVKFFRDVITLKKAQFEAHAWILWTPEKGYFISIPKQTVSAAQVAFTYDDDALPKDAIIVVDIHSHNSMGAFYSSTDDNNDRTGVYYSGVVGKLTPTSFDFVFRFNLHEAKLECKLEDVFEVPVKPEVEVPQEWLDNVSVNTPPYVNRGYMGPGSYTGKNGQVTTYIPQSERNRPYDFSQKNRDPNFVPGVNQATLARWKAETERYNLEDELKSSENRNRQASQYGKDFIEKDGLLVDTVSGEVIELAPRRSLRQEAAETEKSFNSSAANQTKETYQTSEVIGGTSSQDKPNDGRSLESFGAGTEAGTAAQNSLDDYDELTSEMISQNTQDSPGEYDYYALQYGDLVAGAKEDIDVSLHDIKNCDEALEDTIRQAFEMLSAQGKNKLMTEGIS